mgnify:CR=1 FL=1
MSELKVNLLKITEDKWVVVPERNTVQEILDLIQKLGEEEFKQLITMEYIIDDKDGQPDILKASEIIYRYSQPEKILFELYETF